ncbi:MAG: agmatinase family protein [Thaumarchaeota archaeon]|nr:agmatinase family protein [Nitrososphaerota archaeon]
MRTQAEYPAPRYRDPKDRRLVQIIKQARSSRAGAVNLMGVPFDGAVLGRKGAAGGPAGIRQALSSFSNYSLELGSDLSGAKVFDLGDVVTSQDVFAAHTQIEKEVAEALGGDSLLLVLGGDNSISLPSLRAFGKKFGKVGLIVVDSHFDLRGEIGGKPTSGSSYGLAVRTAKGLDPRRFAEIGIHGFLNSREYAREAAKNGMTVYTASDVRQEGATAIARDAYGVASKGCEAVYLSIDLDAVDLAYVSGVSAPSAGGISAADLFDIAYYLGGRDKVRCADLVELAPQLDPSGRSQITAATALVYLMAGFSSRA